MSKDTGDGSRFHVIEKRFEREALQKKNKKKKQSHVHMTAQKRKILNPGRSGEPFS